MVQNVKCVRPTCGHEWKYKGSSLYVTCPKCRNLKKLGVLIVGDVVPEVNEVTQNDQSTTNVNDGSAKDNTV